MKSDRSGRRDRPVTDAEYRQALDAARALFVVPHGPRPTNRDPRLPARPARSAPQARLYVHRDENGCAVDVYLPGSTRPAHVRGPVAEVACGEHPDGHVFALPIDEAAALITAAGDVLIERARHGRLS